ncbi:MAG: (2Fe-2S)-binding protein [Elusimicrobia bacterium]|nr:(2Fe-2S)-binding protein [Elusimicrobiota bacterium]
MKRNPPPRLQAPPRGELAFNINGKTARFKGHPFKRLLDVLREDLGLTGTKEGCGEGECGACTVLLDGQPVPSCLIPVAHVEGKRIETVESLASPNALSPLQKAFMEEAAAQCGMCSPGILLSSWAWVRSGGSDDPKAIRRHLAGNLCRCTGYQSIVEAVVKTVRKQRKGRASS